MHTQHRVHILFGRCANDLDVCSLTEFSDEGAIFVLITSGLRLVPSISNKTPMMTFGPSYVTPNRGKNERRYLAPSPLGPRRYIPWSNSLHGLSGSWILYEALPTILLRCSWKLSAPIVDVAPGSIRELGQRAKALWISTWLSLMRDAGTISCWMYSKHVLQTVWVEKRVSGEIIYTFLSLLTHNTKTKAQS